MALLFPSVGPIYEYPDLFAELNIHRAFELQKQLWLHYNDVLLHPENFTTFVYEGVAAFLCLHVGIVVLFCIFSKGLNKILFIIMISCVVIIQTGSVHLGWHYAIDGYFGVLLAFFCYFITRPREAEKPAPVERSEKIDRPAKKYPVLRACLRLRLKARIFLPISDWDNKSKGDLRWPLRE